MKIYPNPTRSTAYISVPSEFINGGNLGVRNQGGEIIEARTFKGYDSQLLSLDLSKQPTGLYKVSLSDDSAEVSSDLLNLMNSN